MLVEDLWGLHDREVMGRQQPYFQTANVVAKMSSKKLNRLSQFPMVVNALKKRNQEEAEAVKCAAFLRGVREGRSRGVTPELRPR